MSTQPSMPDKPMPQSSTEVDLSPRGLATSWLDFREGELRKSKQGIEELSRQNEYGPEGTGTKADFLEQVRDTIVVEQWCIADDRELIEEGDTTIIDRYATREKERRAKLEQERKEDNS